MRNAIIDKTIEYVKKELQNAEGGHDWWHIYRVWMNAKKIHEREGGNRIIVELAALLHDIADPKFHEGDEEIGPKKAREFLESHSIEIDTIFHVIQIMKNMSFKNSFENSSYISQELAIVQDADRLDAIGAIGIARAFNYGGFKNRAIYDPSIAPNLNLTKAAYKSSTTPTINHFYEKLLLLKDKMLTKTGMEIAHKRHSFMLEYLKKFYEEWGIDE